MTNDEQAWSVQPPTTKEEVDLLAMRGAELARVINGNNTVRDAVVTVANEQNRMVNAPLIAELAAIDQGIAAFVSDNQNWRQLAGDKLSGAVTLTHVTFLRRRKSKPVLVFPEGKERVEESARKLRRKLKYGLFKRKVTYTFQPDALMNHPRLMKRWNVVVQKQDTVTIDYLPKTRRGTVAPEPVHRQTVHLPSISS